MRAQTIAEVLGERARSQPSTPAFLFLEKGEREAGALTYAELDRRARTIAAFLVERGARGQPVMLAYPTGLEFVAALFGCFHAGAIAVPAPMALHERATERVAQIVGDTGASLGLTLARWLPDLAALRPTGPTWIASDSLVDGPATELASTEASAIAMLQYTSGTTGTPRGVMLTHRNLMANLRAASQAGRVTAADVVVSWLPIHHDMGLLGGVMSPVFDGLRSVLMSPISFVQQPLRWLKAIDRYRATLASSPCFAYDLCVRRSTPEQRAQLDLSRWRTATCGGEPVRPAVLERFADAFAIARFDRAALKPAYGLAEATLMVTMPDSSEGLCTRALDAVALAAGRVEPAVEPARERHLASCGRAWGDQQYAIVDPAISKRLPAETVGEVWVRGSSVAAGYWRRELDSAASFQAQISGEDGRWLRTGDLGFACADGLVICGRLKDLVIVHGRNFDPLDLERAAARSHPSLTPGEGAAFPVDTDRGEALVLIHEVERATARDLDYAEVVVAVATELSRTFGLGLHDLLLVHAGKLPRTTSGKIQRQLCRRRYAQGGFADARRDLHPVLGRARVYAGAQTPYIAPQSAARIDADQDPG
jgi:acyl-CoA synthetase (AMP-forming)/AMP-acid ligase II